MSDFHLAQVNVGRMLAPLDSPQLAGFVDQLQEINAVADQAPGFIWRMVDDSGADATNLRPEHDDDLLLINCSVWESVEALRNYTYRSDHLKVLARRRDWFERLAGVSVALWWVPAGHRPTMEEAMGRIALIREKGEGPEAFTFRAPHPPPSGSPAEPAHPRRSTASPAEPAHPRRSTASRTEHTPTERTPAEHAPR